jgi:hypothetical protein
VSAITNVEKVYSYYQTTFGRNGIGGAGADITAIIHFGTADTSGDSDNAVWNSAANAMIFGDGGNQFSALAACLDVVAHEMTHGVTAATARLEYHDQSGALNESFSDVFGVIASGSNWTIGDGCVVGGGPLRNLANPEAEGDPATFADYVHTTQDYGGVHTNSGIPNRAAYLIAQGLTSESSGVSIGNAETAQIYYRALTTYLTPTATFLDARFALVQSAKDLYGAQSTEVSAVNDAFDAIGVTESEIATPDTITPTSTVPPNGTDLIAYLYNNGGNWSVCAQFLTNPFTGYDASQDFCNLNSTTPVFRSPPVTFNYSSGTYILFIGADFNVYAIDPSGTVSPVTNTGNVWSIAVTQDGAKFAIISNSVDDNTIGVGDIATGSTQTYSITAPVYDGQTQEAVQYLNSTAFDYSGKQIVFEALNCLPLQGSSCSPGTSGGLQYYSLGVLELSSATIIYPFGNENFNFDLVDPRFAFNNNFVITFDLLDWTNYGSTANVEGVSYVANLATAGGATVTFAGDRGPFAYNDPGLYSHPSFFADDAHLDLQLWDSTGTLLTQYQFPVSSSWSVDAGSGVQINPYDTEVAVAGNTGTRPNVGSVQSDKSSLDFGNMQLGTSSARTVTITNNQNHDVNITDVTLSGSAFSDNLQPTFLPQGASVTVTISARPTGSFGTRNGALNLTTDGNPATLDIPVTVLGYGIPTATSAQYSVKHNTQLSGTLAGTTPNSGALTYSMVTQPGHGSVKIDASTGKFTYTPTNGFSGADSFSFKVSDSYAESAPGTVSLHVASAAGSGSGSSGGGGGALGIFWLLLLLERFRKRRVS